MRLAKNHLFKLQSAGVKEIKTIKNLNQTKTE